MKRMYNGLTIIMFLFILLAGCSTNEQNVKASKKVEITVSAAASLQDSLNEIKGLYEKQHSNIKINYNFGASGTLAQQISQGAPVDIFFSAAEDKFDQLVQKGIIEKADSMNLVGNSLVLVVPTKEKQTIHTLNDLSKADKISIGTPEAVPAGMYAKESFEYLQLWEGLEKKVVYAKDVRQVLNYVETGNVDAGIVYKTDALTSKKIKIVATADEKTHTPIIYPIGMVKESSHPKETKQFYKYIESDASMKVFKKYGFKGLN